MTQRPSAPSARTTVRRLGYVAGLVLLLIGSALILGRDASQFMLQRLAFARHLPESASNQNDVVYVLGGTTESLRAKFRVASGLIRAGKATRILVLARQARMEFSRELGRNLSAEEWAIQQFRALDVGADTLEFVGIEEGSFGTWSEANGLARLLEARKYQRLLLVTSSYHGRRVWESFSHTIEQPERRLFLYLTDEPAYLRHVVPEYVKLLVYRALLY